METGETRAGGCCLSSGRCIQAQTEFGPSWSSSQLIGRLCVSQDSRHTLTHASAQKDALVNQPISCWEHGSHAGFVLQSEDILETRNLDRPSSFPGFSTGQT